MLQPKKTKFRRQQKGRQKGNAVSYTHLDVYKRQVGGVEPQSETVWRQADKYNVPRIAYVLSLIHI